jgi:hypothetical protein
MFEFFVDLFQRLMAFIMSIFEMLGLTSKENLEQSVQLIPPVASAVLSDVPPMAEMAPMEAQ